MNAYSFITVSNRLPVSVSKQNGKLVYTHSSGGLATAMSSVDVGAAGEQLWIGWPGIASDDLTSGDKAAITRKLKEFGCFPVFLSRNQVANFYEGYANDTLWPLFHYFQSTAQYNETYWRSYRSVNTLFAKAVAKMAQPNATIWVHDYHFLLLPQQLRSYLPESSIGFFLHIPFPSYEIFRLLPERREILEGLLGADLVGFHIYDYARHFLSSVLRILGYEHVNGTIALRERSVTVDAFPIGIDYEKFKKGLGSPTTKEHVAILHEHYKGQKIILSVDRLDYSKGIMRRLEAYEMLLKENPQYLKKTALVMIAVPSRIEVEAYKDLRDTIERAVSRINGTYGSVDWTPISYQFKNLPFDEVLALYAASDVALVTPLRDGMNLVAKEYVASKQREPGVLILSEMAGAVDELPEALRINPNDIRSIVCAITKALTMPKAEQREMMRSMQRRIADYSVQRWAADFIEQLGIASQAQDLYGSKVLTKSVREAIVNGYQHAKSRLLLIDYDGTVRGFVSGHEQHLAKPSRKLLHMIEQFSIQPGTHVCIVSGRTRDALESWFGHLPISLIAEHGAWIKDGGEWSQDQSSFKEQKKKILPLLKQYAERTAGARIEEKSFALVWHYRKVATELAYARNARLKHDLHNLLSDSDIGVYSGNKIIEIKPHAINKGVAANVMLAMYPSDFVLCLGDDYTDEDMFDVLPEEAYSIKVGPGATHAHFRLGSVEEVIKFLKPLADSTPDL